MNSLVSKMILGGKTAIFAPKLQTILHPVRNFQRRHDHPIYYNKTIYGYDDTATLLIPTDGS